MLLNQIQTHHAIVKGKGGRKFRPQMLQKPSYVERHFQTHFLIHQLPFITVYFFVSEIRGYQWGDGF